MDIHITNKYFKIWAMQFYSNFNPFSNNNTSDQLTTQNDIFINNTQIDNNYPVIIEHSEENNSLDNVIINKEQNIKDIYNYSYKFYNLPKIKQDIRFLIKNKVLLRVIRYYLKFLPLPLDIIENIFNLINLDYYTSEESKFIQIITNKIASKKSITKNYFDAIQLKLHRFLLDANIIQKIHYDKELNIEEEQQLIIYRNLTDEEIFYDNKYHIINDCIDTHNYYSDIIGKYLIKDYYFEFLK